MKAAIRNPPVASDWRHACPSGAIMIRRDHDLADGLRPLEEISAAPAQPYLAAFVSHTERGQHQENSDDGANRDEEQQHQPDEEHDNAEQLHADIAFRLGRATHFASAFPAFHICGHDTPQRPREHEYTGEPTSLTGALRPLEKRA